MGLSVKKLQRAYESLDKIYAGFIIVGISVESPTPTSGIIRLICECVTCGKVVVKRPNTVYSNRSNSCGCLMRVRPARTAPGESGLNELYRSYRKEGVKRNLEFDISLPTFTRFTSSVCFYCGAEPSGRYTGSRLNRTEYGTYLYNGLDRVDNAIGYLEHNVVACCKVCNIAKGTMTLDEFLFWIQKVHSHVYSLQAIIPKETIHGS